VHTLEHSIPNGSCLVSGTSTVAGRCRSGIASRSQSNAAHCGTTRHACDRRSPPSVRFVRNAVRHVVSHRSDRTPASIWRPAIRGTAATRLPPRRAGQATCRGDGRLEAMGKTSPDPERLRSWLSSSHDTSLLRPVIDRSVRGPGPSRAFAALAVHRARHKGSIQWSPRACQRL
jgi:hypothetical protein